MYLSYPFLVFFHEFCLQLFYYRYMLGRAWAADGWLNALKVLVMGPGWQPGKSRLGDITDIPDVSGLTQQANYSLRLSSDSMNIEIDYVVKDYM